jgi:hypothetical protein
MRPDAMHTSLFPTVMRSTVLRGAALVLAGALTLPGCTAAQRDALGSSYLIIDSLTAAPGATPTAFSHNLESDVCQRPDPLGPCFVMADRGQVSLRLALTDPGIVTNPATPSAANFITLSRYSVRYIPNDGVSPVPASFEGSLTGTVTGSGLNVDVVIVNAHAKAVDPLAPLALALTSLPATAEVTLFGSDQAGRDVSVTGTISIVFADWAD